ncbi:MAG: AMP-binding protein, partial [Verrucomicrobiae bacterium]|nr:AMP-binding protein [Verrucomicrobiae bacterium]
MPGFILNPTAKVVLWMNLAKAFVASAESNLEKTAVFWGDCTFSYRHFLEQSGWVAQTLRAALGVRPGDRVGLWLRNCPEFISCLLYTS